MILIKAGNLPTWDKVNQILDRLLPLIKTFDKDSLSGVKICASLEGYVKISLKEGKVQKQEFNW